MKKYFAPLVIAIALAISNPVIVSAAYSAPSTIQVLQVNVYRNCLELQDQLYLIWYRIDYAADPSEGIDDLYLCRLLDTDGVTELRAVAPYADANGNDGYDYGVISIYFNATDAPTWDQDYEMELTGNPSLDWGGDPPADRNDAFSDWYDGTTLAATSTTLTSRIRYLAGLLENYWATDLYDASTGQFETAGEAYFSNVITNLRQICPDLYSEVVSTISVEERVYTDTQADTYEGRLVGTWLDFTGFAADWGLSHLWITSIIWMTITMAMVMIITNITKSMRPTFFLVGMMALVGGFIGMLTWGAIAIMAVIAGVGMAYTFGVRGTGA